MLQLHEKPRECPDLWGKIVMGKGIINVTRHGKKRRKKKEKKKKKKKESQICMEHFHSANHVYQNSIGCLLLES